MANESAAISRHPGLCPGRHLSACENGDLGRGNHQGQRSQEPREQAGHKTASDNMQITSKMSCYAGAIHTGHSRQTRRILRCPLRRIAGSEDLKIFNQTWFKSTDHIPIEEASAVAEAGRKRYLWHSSCLLVQHAGLSYANAEFECHLRQ